MRKVILLLLIVLALGQGAWAKAASYCLHESSPATRHFGHHTHAHQPGAAAVDSAAGDVDCGVCHLGAAYAVSSMRTPAAIGSRDAPLPSLRAQNNAPHPEQPDRPNWFSLA